MPKIKLTFVYNKRKIFALFAALEVDKYGEIHHVILGADWERSLEWLENLSLIGEFF